MSAFVISFKEDTDYPEAIWGWYPNEEAAKRGALVCGGAIGVVDEYGHEIPNTTGKVYMTPDPDAPEQTGDDSPWAW